MRARWGWVAKDCGYETPCQVYTGYIDPKGYGRFGSRKAHRIAYEEEHGPIPGMAVHHLCENPACIRVSHLVALTVSAHSILHNPREIATHCRHGHEFTPDNVLDNGQGYRSCRTCHRAAVNRHDQRRRQRVTV